MSLEVSSLRAVAHPVRLRMLSLLTGVDMSAAEIARELGITQANASYHLRQLAASGHVVEAGTEKIRGGVAKRYTHPWREGAPRPKGGTTDSSLVEVIANELVRRAGLRSPGLALLTDAELWVSPEVWREATDLVHQASSLLHESARRPRSNGSVHVNMTAAMFQMTTGQMTTGQMSAETGERAR
jgi:DNA-binding transcriptional ArsR family regulator